MDNYYEPTMALIYCIILEEWEREIKQKEKMGKETREESEGMTWYHHQFLDKLFSVEVVCDFDGN